MKHYRVDKMRNMEVLKLPRSEASLKQRVDLASFGKKTFGMIGGVDVQVKLVCANYLAGVVLDRFGPDIWMLPQDEDHFYANVTVTVSPQFFGWVTAIVPHNAMADRLSLSKSACHHHDCRCGLVVLLHVIFWW